MTVQKFSNPQRTKKEVYEKYRPQYRALGIKPEPAITGALPEGASFGASERSNIALHGETVVHPEPLPLDNPRAPRPAMRQPYAPPPREEGSFIRGTQGLPNVGNNMEHSWAALDGKVIDDLSPEFDAEQAAHQEWIDNNDYIDVDRMQLRRPAWREATFSSSDKDFEESTRIVGEINRGLRPAPVVPTGAMKKVQEKTNAEKLVHAFTSTPPGEFLVFIDGEVVSSGDQAATEQDVEAWLLGQHDIAGGVAILPERITIVRKVALKVGVSLIE